MPLPLLAAAAAKAVAAKAAAATAVKAAAAKAVTGTAAKTALGTAAKAAAGTAGKGNLSIGMLAEKGVNKYPGTAIDKFKNVAGKVGEVTKNMGEGGGKPEFESPTSANFAPNNPSNPNTTYSEQINKLKSLQ